MANLRRVFLSIWQDAGGVVAASVVGVPKTSLHLAANYRTHAGILNVAAAVVDVVREYHPMVSTAAAILLAVGIPALKLCITIAEA